MTPARPVGPRRWKLWHFATVVLIAALLLGAVRAVSVRLTGPPRGGNAFALAAFAVWFILLLVALVQGFGAGSNRNRRGRSNRPLARLRQWAVRRGGVLGFLAWVVGFGLELAAILAVVLLTAFAPMVIAAWWSRPR